MMTRTTGYGLKRDSRRQLRTLYGVYGYRLVSPDSGRLVAVATTRRSACTEAAELSRRYEEAVSVLRVGQKRPRVA
jgi:hypothetical protein